MDGRRVVQRVPAGFWQQLFVAGVDDGCDNSTLLVAMRIVGRFDRASVERALECLIDRHEALRTTLRRARDGSLEQVIWDRVPCVVQDRDLRASPDALQEQLLEYVDAWSPVFDAPLVSARVFALGDAEHAVAIRVHHAIADGWSCAILAFEFCTLYLAYEAGREPALEPVTLQYRHACELETAPVSPASEAHWRARLADRPSSRVELVGEPSLARRLWLVKATPVMGAARTSALAEIASTARVSTATAALAAVAASFLLHDQEQVRVAVVHANRYRPALRPVVGEVVDMIPVDIDLRGDPTYREVVARTQRAWMTTLAHRVPMAQLCRLKGRDLADGTGVFCDFEFNHLAVLNNAGAPAEGFDESRFEPLDVPVTERRVVCSQHVTVAPWGLFVSETDVLQGAIAAQEGTISSSALGEIGAALTDTLAQVVDQPDRPLRRLLAGVPAAR